MEKENSQRPEEKKVNMQLRLVINVVTAAIFFVADLYVMINMPTYIPVLIIITILFLAAIVFLLDTVFKNAKEKERQSQEVYDSILKSEKASYLLMKKSFEELSSLLEMTDVKSEGATDEIIDAQKALAKVIINREKENADALMNSNDNVVEKVILMERMMTDLKPSILEEQQSHIKAANDEVVLKQEKLFIELNNMEASMKDGMNQVSDKLSGFQEEIEKMADTLANMVSSIAEQTAAAANTMAAAPVSAPVPEPMAVTAEPKVSPVIAEAPVMPEESLSFEEPVMAVESEPVISTPMENISMESVEVDSISADIDSSNMMMGEDIKLEEILSIDDIVNSITEEKVSEDIALDSDIRLDSMDTLGSDISLDNMDALDSDISLDNMDALGSDISLDSMDALDSDISLDNMGALDSDISLDNMDALGSDISLDNMDALGSDISLDNMGALDSDISLDNMGALDSDISLDSMSDEMSLEELEGLDLGNLDITENDFNLDSLGNTKESALDMMENLTDSSSLDELSEDMNFDSIEALANEIGIVSDISLDGEKGDGSSISLEELEGLDLGNLNLSENDFNLDSMEDTDNISLEEVAAEEPKPTAMPDLSNPNKVMTPDEIAALIAGASEPEEKKEEPAEEPKPAMPDLSNPNKVMTPDEIAALLANM